MQGHHVQLILRIKVFQYTAFHQNIADADIDVLKLMGPNGEVAADKQYFPTELVVGEKKKKRREAKGVGKKSSDKSISNNADGTTTFLDEYRQEINTDVKYDD
jgi:hypothetical protein